MNLTTFLLFPVLLIILYWLSILILHLFGKSHPPLPPGPKGLPIIGDVLSALNNKRLDNSEPLWAHYIEIGKKYGSDIIHINVLGNHTIVLNSVEHTNELLEKRSALYSDRPSMYMNRELVGWYWNFSSMRYSSWWRLHRRTFHQYFHARAIAAYHPFIRQSTSTTLRKFIQTKTNEDGSVPDVQFDQLSSAVREHAAAIILYIAYGIDTSEETEYYAELAHAAAEGLIATLNPGSFFVDYFPVLKFVPAWFPGASFKSKAKKWAPPTAKLLDEPWKRLQINMRHGETTPCFATKNLEKFSIRPGESDSKEQKNMEEVIKDCAAIAYLGGVDTTTSLLLSCILALSYHPDVQKKAQTELDSVIGSSRLPNFNDREKLPYIETIFKETQRMFPVLPLAVAHCSTSGDFYSGYYIPKGATVIANAWAILHDPEVYHDPLVFNPDRFMKENKSDLPPNPELYTFGFGRRICPGRYLALDSAWTLIACILATCDISKSNTDLKKNIDPMDDFIDGGLVHPKPFKCRIIPRSEAALNLMRTGYSTEES